MKTLKLTVALSGIALALSVCCVAAQDKASDNSASNATAQPDLGNLRTFVELARSDIKTQKALLVAQNLPLTEDEAIDFWPLHREYEDELSKLNDQRFALIERFAKSYGNITDKEAEKLAKTSFDLEKKRTELKQKYFKKFSKVIPPAKAARFFQIENQLNMALELRVASSLPLIK